MRRLALITALLLAGAGSVLATVAGADDSHEYRVELDNAFGVVQGSDIRVAGVNVGSVKDLDINEDKRAVVTFTTSGPLGQLGVDTECSSEPQSLIAEYFLDCQPQGEPLPEGGTIPVEQTTQTVQADLVQNTLREPFKRRFQIIVNEFGTALAGNPENLNEAVRRGAPALRDLEAVLDILAEQNEIIRDLNADSDTIMAQLAERREDVVRFIQTARDTAAASAARRADLSRDFELLDDFLAELQPTLADTEALALEQTPLLADLRAAGPGLGELATNLPPFNAASLVSLESLGKAGLVGQEALEEGADEVSQLRESARNAPAAVGLLVDFLRDLDDPRRATEINERVEADTGRDNPEPGQPDTMGYTGLEGLLNYFYYQAGAINQFDSVSHILHVTIYGVESDPCGQFRSGYDEETGEPGVPAEPATGKETTTDFLEADTCIGWLGPNQPGINEDIGLPPYDPSVCPHGTEPAAAEQYCDPDGEPSAVVAGKGRNGGGAGGGSSQGGAPSQPDSGGGSGDGSGGGALPPLPDTTLPADPEDVIESIEDLLGLPEGGGLGQLGKGFGSGADRKAAKTLLDFLFVD